jgi:hypothetical protein
MTGRFGVGRILMEAVDHDDGVDVVGHDDGSVDVNVGMVFGDRGNLAFGNCAGGRRNDFPASREPREHFLSLVQSVTKYQPPDR